MKSRWLEHRSRRIMYSDFSNFGRDTDALNGEIMAADAMICAEPRNSVLVLIDVRGTTTTTQALSLYKQSAARTKGWIIRQAVVGATGIQKILASAVARFSAEELVLFDDVEEAKDWLVTGEGKGETISPM